MSSLGAVAQAADLLPPTLDATGKVKAEVGTVNGKNVLRYTWRDSSGKPRSASLVCHDAAGTNCGGYAWQFTYQAADGTAVQVNASAKSDGGFGYFVSHELYRQFSNGTSSSIAKKHGQDDSPLSKTFTGVGTAVSADTIKAVHQYTLNYPHWGTLTPMANDAVVPVTLATHKKYDIPVKMTWTFTNGVDYPLWNVEYDFSAVPVNTVYADVRGPYGQMDFDNGAIGNVTGVEWGDKYLFAAQPVGGGVTTNSPWQWDVPNTGSRYNLLVAGAYEMGLVENKAYKNSILGSSWSDSRGKNSTQGLGCAPTLMPCDWEWAYQSIQYGLTTSPTFDKKLAWGSAGFVGSDLTTVFVNNTDSEPFLGYPKMAYGVWITFDKSSGAKTRNLASSNGQAVVIPSPKVVYSLDNGHVYMTGTATNGTIINVTNKINGLATQAGNDDRINVSFNGAWLVFNSERFDPDCAGLACLVVMPSNLSSARIIRQANGLVARAADEKSTINSTGKIVVFPQAGGPHALDLWLVKLGADNTWGDPVLLTGNSPYQYHRMPVYSSKGDKVIFECGNGGRSNVGLCEVSNSGKDFHTVLQVAGVNLLHPDYGLNDGIIFTVATETDRQLAVLNAGTTVPVLVNGNTHFNHSPCVLPKGQVISLWQDSASNPTRGNEIRQISANGATVKMLQTGIDVWDVGIGCGQ
ncbi:hypothetical protein JCM14076_09830 [Methylosoma difficile]